MLFMVVESFPPENLPLIGERFQSKGRLMPDDIRYVSSWISTDGASCFQLMEAPSSEALNPWIDAWKDLVEFKVTPVLTSQEYWSANRA